MEEVELPTCLICLESFGTFEPNIAYLLLCGHSYHRHCITKISETSKSNEIICPLCHSPTPGNSSLKLNCSLFNLLEVLQKDQQEQDKSTPCDECDTVASLFCVSCDVPYCGEHDKIAHIVKAMASHNRVPISKKNLHAVKKCKEHNEVLKIFCITCQSSICSLCHEGLHNTHQTDLITSIVSQAQSELQNSLQKTEKSVECLDKTLVMLTESVEKVRRCADDIDKKIDIQVEELIICLQSRASFLKEEAKKIAIEKEGLLNKQREKVVVASALGHALCGEIQHVLHKDEGLLIESMKQITEKIQAAQSVCLLKGVHATNKYGGKGIKSPYNSIAGITLGKITWARRANKAFVRLTQDSMGNLYMNGDAKKFANKLLIPPNNVIDTITRCPLPITSPEAILWHSKLKKISRHWEKEFRKEVRKQRQGTFIEWKDFEEDSE